MVELFQTEGCAECRRVREKLSELLIDFVARQVPDDEAQRTRLRQATGQTAVPVLIDTEHKMIVTESHDIIAYLEETYQQQPLVE